MGEFIVEATQFSDLKMVTPKKYQDFRGYFTESYNSKALGEKGIHTLFVQDNFSFSKQKGTLRGLHFQLPPYAQDKLIQVVEGSIFDAVVDLRKDSPTFGKSFYVVLSAEKGNQLFVPKGFAHGFVTLEPDTLVHYKVTNYYAPEYERGLLWNDPDLNIPWPLSTEEVLINARDSFFPALKNLSAS